MCIGPGCERTRGEVKPQNLMNILPEIRPISREMISHKLGPGWEKNVSRASSLSFPHIRDGVAMVEEERREEGDGTGSMGAGSLGDRTGVG